MKGNLAMNVVADGLAAVTAPMARGGDLNLVGHVEVQLSAQVGTLTMSIERLFGLKSGDVVEMNELLDEPVTLMLNGRPVAKAELVALDDHFGVRILEIA
jgi:flagellar motor switch protein FliN/FliY